MNTTVLVFSDSRYLALGAAILAGMLFAMLRLSGYVFLEPYFVGHIPPGTEAGLTMIVALSFLVALVLPMNIYRIAALRGSGRKMGGGVAGSILGAAVGACGCGPVGFAIISTFGSFGATASAFATNYETPIRLVIIAFLVFTYVTTTRSLGTECRVRS